MNSTFDDHPHPATIQIPTGEPNGAKAHVSSVFSAMEGKRLILEAPERISMSTPVSVEYNDALFLGEVMLCKPIGEGNYRVEIFVEQILTGLQSLMALRAGLLGDSQAATAPRAMAPSNLQSPPGNIRPVHTNCLSRVSAQCYFCILLLFIRANARRFLWLTKGRSKHELQSQSNRIRQRGS